MQSSQQIIDECRQKHALAAKSGFKPEYESSTHAMERHLFNRGRPVWGSVVKANRALYLPGKIDLWGCAVFSFDPYFDGHTDELEAIRAAVSGVRGSAPQDPVMSEFAKMVSEDYASFPRSLVPQSLSHGREVWYQEICIVRSRLPVAYLVDRLLPIIADANASAGIMVPPINCWADELVEEWKAKAASRPPAIEASAPRVSLKEFLANPLTITPTAAKELQRAIAQNRLKRASLRVGHEHGAYSMDLTEASPGRDDFSYTSQQICVIISLKCTGALMGIELDFKGGYTFTKRPGQAPASKGPRSWWARMLGK